MSLPKLFSRNGQAEILIILLLLAVGLFFAGGLLTFDKAKTIPKGTQTITLDNAQTPQQNLQLRTINITSECSKVKGVIFLVDNSGSMSFGSPSKLASVQSGISNIVSKFNDDDMVGLYSFNSPPFQGTGGDSPIRELVAINYYKDVKNGQMTQGINAMRATGSTYLRDAFSSLKDKIQAAKNSGKYDGYNMAVILFSDGIPEDLNPDPNDTTNFPRCITQQQGVAPRCFSRKQDPTEPPDITQEIKDMNVKIYTIALYAGLDEEFRDLFENLLNKASSGPDYFKKVFNPNDLDTIAEQLSVELCK